MKSVRLRELLLAQQAELVTGLDTARGVVEHPTDLGTIVEIDWCAAFKKFLPERYAVNKATIVDAEGNRSDSIDLVVHDAIHSPLLFEKGGVRYLPAESVYAVFEIKQDLNKNHVGYAAEKAASVRGLRRTSAPFINAVARLRRASSSRSLQGFSRRRRTGKIHSGHAFEARSPGAPTRGASI
jgi:hypothetical protein